MSRDAAPAYGLWRLVVVNSLVFIIFAFSFLRPRRRRDWRSFGAFAAFLVALFGDAYREYMKQVPAFVPRVGSRAARSAAARHG